MESRAQGSFEKILRRRLLRTAGYVTLVGVVLFFLEALVVELIPLGPWFRWMVAVVAPVVAVLAAFWLMRLEPRASDLLRRLGRVANAMPRPLALVLLFAIMTASLSPRLVEYFSRASDAEAALQEFYVIYSPNVEPPRVERTLAEFERARRRLEGQWPTPPKESPTISLRLFRNLREYQAVFGSGTWSVGGMRCEENGAVIGVPLEEASTFLSEEHPSRTPLHEMVHATMCQSLGTQAFYSIPSWFHEGMAQLYEGEGFTQLDERALNRFTVWFKRGDLMTPEEFCRYMPRSSPAGVSLFYATAWEFARSLEARHGRDALNAVVSEVASGRTFEDSLQTHLSGACTSLYGDWSRDL